MKIAVVGGGIFGVTVAALLGRKHHVDLFEKKPALLMAASGVNQFRLHRGYHYPRSPGTVRSLKSAESSFRREYSGAILDRFEHYYCISARDSLTSRKDYLEFCRRHGLSAEETSLGLIRPGSVDLCIRASECLLDPDRLMGICNEKLKASGVSVHLGTEATADSLRGYGQVVNCTYAALNRLLEPEERRKYQFELCEKPLVRLPPEFAGKSIVIMDGPFMCVDPFGRTGLSLMGNVVHAIHQRIVGEEPRFDERFLPLLDRGIVSNPAHTNFDRFIESASEFFPSIRKAEHVGSMYTVRAVLPGVDGTDERPTLVEKGRSGVISVFSGKIANCVDAAERVSALIG